MQRTFDEQRLVRLEQARELPRHALAQSPVEVNTDVEPERAHIAQALYRAVQYCWRIDPRHRICVPISSSPSRHQHSPRPARTGRVHLHRGEPLHLAPLCRRKQPREVVAADPPVHAHAVAHRAPEQCMHGHAERLALDVPQRDVEPGERALQPRDMRSGSALCVEYWRWGDWMGSTHHEHGSTGVEAAAHGGLPDVLDAVRARADEALQVGERALDGLRVSLKRRLAPADDAVGGFDAHEEPPRRDTEGLAGRPTAVSGRNALANRRSRRTSIFAMVEGAMRTWWLVGG